MMPLNICLISEYSEHAKLLQDQGHTVAFFNNYGNANLFFTSNTDISNTPNTNILNYDAVVVHGKVFANILAKHANCISTGKSGFIIGYWVEDNEFKVSYYPYRGKNINTLEPISSNNIPPNELANLVGLLSLLSICPKTLALQSPDLSTTQYNPAQYKSSTRTLLSTGALSSSAQPYSQASGTLKLNSPFNK